MAPPLPPKAPKPEPSFHPNDTFKNTAWTTAITGGTGLMGAAVKVALTKQNVGASAVISRHGGMIAQFTAVGATYQFSRDSAANLRGKEDAYNEAIAGALAGALLGVSRRSIPAIFGFAAATSITMAAYKVSGEMTGSMKQKYENNEDRLDQKEKERKTYRRPIEETIEILGEGRGIYAPGYSERRRERLLEKYGVDVGPYQDNSR